jgi:thiol-disulfide isomerase/thioredoxin
MKIISKLIFLITITLTFSCKHHVNITIAGSLDSANGTIVKIESDNYKTVFDSTVVKDGKFSLHSELPEEGFYELRFYTQTKDQGMLVNHNLLYAENQKSYKFTAKGLADISFNDHWQSSSFHQVKLNEFKHLVNLIRDTLTHKKKYYLNKADEALNTGKNTQYSAYLDSVSKADDKINNTNLYAIHQFIRSNPNTVVTPYLIDQVYDMFENYTLYRNIMTGLSPEVKRSKYYNQAEELLKSVDKINIGTVAQPLAGKTLTGADFKMNFGAKKVILLDFWASYCVPCRQQIPDMKALYDKYRNKGFEIISVSIDEDQTKWRKASAQDSIPWYNVSESVEQRDSKNIKNFVIKSIPSNYVLNNKGQFIGQDLSLDSLENILKKLK